MEKFENKNHNKRKIKTLKQYLYGIFGLENNKIKKIASGESKKQFFNKTIKNNKLEKAYIEDPDL